MARIKNLCTVLSDWEVREARSRWKGGEADAKRLAWEYGCNYKTLLRAFKRMDERKVTV